MTWFVFFELQEQSMDMVDNLESPKEHEEEMLPTIACVFDLCCPQGPRGLDVPGRVSDCGPGVREAVIL